LISYGVFDESAKFSAVSSSKIEEQLEEAIIRTMKTLKPEVQSYVQKPFLSVNKAGSVHGQDFYHVKTVVQGTDNRMSLYEFLFEKISDEGLGFMNEPEIFSYAQLKINQHSMEENNLKTTNSKGEVQCSLISSYFLCASLAQCNSNDFLATSQCK